MGAFRILRVFNDDALRAYAGARSRIGQNALPHFSGDTLAERIVRELAARRALPTKEITEAFEFFAATRRFLRHAPSVVDLCSGHGLAGILFAAFERHAEQVVLCDRRKPQAFERVWHACLEAAPWIEPKVRFVEGELSATRASLPAHSAVLGVHACGRLTDTCIDIAVELGGPVAVLPCCRAHAMSDAPEGLREALGDDVAYDVHRTYALEARGYFVRWRTIPEAITPMNRVLIAVPRAAPSPVPRPRSPAGDRR